MGHINPTISLVQELKKRGEDVVYYSLPQYKDFITQMGAKFSAYPENERMFNWGLEERVDNDNDALSRLFRAYGRHFSDEHKLFKAFALSQIKDTSQDYIIYDYCDAYWAKQAAVEAGVLSIASSPTFVINSRIAEAQPVECVKYFWRISGENQSYSNAAECRGLIRMVTKRLQYAFNDKTFNPFDYGNSDYLTIVHTSKALQPKGELLDDKFIFKGASIVANRDKQQVPPLTGRPVLYISMGSTQLGNNVRFYRMCMNAFKNSRYQVIIAAGRYTDLNELKDIPENVTVLSYAPQLEILKIASVFITHAGSGSINEAIAFGVPLVALPQMTDAFSVAYQVEQKQIGQCITSVHLCESSLKKAVEEVCNNPVDSENMKKIRTAENHIAIETVAERVLQEKQRFA